MTDDCRQGTADFLFIPKDIFDEMVTHCRQGYPNEACGILAGRGNEVSKVYMMTNTEGSPVSYMMEPSEQFRAMKDMRTNDLSMIAIFHSHPASPACPSAKDLGLAFYDDCVYVIVSLAEAAPVVKGFSIKDGKVKEVNLAVKEKSLSS
jgi:proteasome lid subunit RPN8/RPN11